MIVLTVRGMNKVQTRLRTARGIPTAISAGLHDWGRIQERDMRLSARQAGIKNFTGDLLTGKGIRWEQRPRGTIGRLIISRRGVAVDRMKPHFVSFRTSRTHLMAWARQSRASGIRKLARRVDRGGTAAIKVHPHPYIKAGIARARPKLRPLLQRRLKETLHT